MAAAAGLWWVGSSYLSENPSAASQLSTFLTQPRTRVEVRFDKDSIVQIGDPVIVYDDQVAKPVGRIIDIHGGPTEKLMPVIARKATVEFYSASPKLVTGDYLAYHTTPESMEWMVQMMLPPKTRERIGQLIMNAYREHQSELGELLKPIILQTARDATDVIREEFQNSIDKHEDRIRKLGERYQSELVEQELIPLLQDEIWPIVQQEATPLANDIGMEMWEKLSVWRFGWRIVYDRSPLPERNLVEKEFRRFLNRHGSPIIQERIPHILSLQRTIMSRVSENERVQEVVGTMTGQILQDAEFQQLAADILRDVFVDNERLIDTFAENWQTEEAQRAMAITNKRLEPTITRIGQTLFGDPEQSITPEFSRVLRNRILYKDDRWLVLHLADERSTDQVPSFLPVIQGTTGTENPFHVPKSQFP